MITISYWQLACIGVLGLSTIFATWRWAMERSKRITAERDAEARIYRWSTTAKTSDTDD